MNRIAEVLDEVMDERRIERNDRNFVVEYCDTRKKPVYVRKLQEDESNLNRHVVIIDDSRVLPFLSKMLFIGMKRDDKPDYLLMHGNRGYEPICAIVEPDSIKNALVKIARYQGSRKTPLKAETT